MLVYSTVVLLLLGLLLLQYYPSSESIHNFLRNPTDNVKDPECPQINVIEAYFNFSIFYSTL